MMRWVGAAGGVAAAGVVLAGCGGSGDDAGGGGGETARAASSVPAAPAPREVLEAYERVAASGCTDAADCQAFMTRKLEAAERVRAAMEAKDPSLYAEPIGFVRQAQEQADHYGRDSLGARGNMLAVSLPLQRMVAWFREHPEG
jgi:hypothetical protein